MELSIAQRRLALSLLVANLIALFLFGLRVIATGSTEYWFLFWNVLLAWLPVLFAWLLSDRLKKQRWTEVVPIILTVLWLGFLPNSFYLVTDLIHLDRSPDVSVIFDSVLFVMCIWTSFTAGIISLYWVHRELLSRRTKEIAHIILGFVIVAASFAVYLGRSLEWNSWDIVINPAGLLFDVTERIINPLDYPQAFITTMAFALLIGSVYAVVWSFAQTLFQPVKRTSKRQKK